MQSLATLSKYLIRLLHECSEEKFVQDAIEWAIVTGLFAPTYHLAEDLNLLLGSGAATTRHLDFILQAYTNHFPQQQAA